MKRFRVYDHDLHELLEQQDDYSFRTETGYYVCDLIDALEDPVRFTVQENTGVKVVFGRYIFEGDNVSFNETIFGKTTVLTGTVSRSEAGTWVIMHDKDIPFCLYDSKPRMILGHINEGA